MKIYSAERKRPLKLENIFHWNGYYYGKKSLKYNNKFYKSKSVRFDDTFGGTEEISPDEYFEAAEKYARVMGLDTYDY